MNESVWRLNFAPHVVVYRLRQLDGASSSLWHNGSPGVDGCSTIVRLSWSTIRIRGRRFAKARTLRGVIGYTSGLSWSDMVPLRALRPTKEASMSRHRHSDPLIRGVLSAFDLFPARSRQERRDEIAAAADAEIVLSQAWADVNNGLEWAFEHYEPKTKEQVSALEEREQLKHCAAG